MNNRRAWTGFLVLTFALLGGAALAGPRPVARKKAAPQKKGSEGRASRPPAPPPNAKLGDVWVNPADGAEMVYVPAGEFTLGTSDAQIDSWLKEHPEDKREQFAEEQPQCRVSLPGYWIDRYEVTNAQYLRFVKVAGHHAPLYWEGGRVPAGAENLPVVGVDWGDAGAYCKWAGGRLPTELEWEKAARGADGRLFPWGNQWDSKRCSSLIQVVTTPSPGAWVVETTGAKMAAVGSYPSGASPYGALDMAGNVWEWCGDWYDEKAYQRYAQGDLTPPATGTCRVLRGGSVYNGIPGIYRCAHRDSIAPDVRDYGIGFRCVRGPA